jgi:pentatricopeptide repeat protein
VNRLISYRKPPNAGAADTVLRNNTVFAPQQWTALLNGLAKKKQTRWAVLVLEWMACNGAEPNVFHYSCVISACEKGRQWKKALALLEEVKERKGIEPDVKMYNPAISACEKGGQWEKALALLEEVKEREGIEPTVYTYSAAISACEKGGQWEKALALLEEVKERKGIEPDVYTYSAAISACEKGGQWEKALALLEEVKERKGVEPNVKTYTAAISACEKGGQWEKALALLEEVKERKGIEPTVYTYSAALNAVSDQPVIARQLYLEAAGSNIYPPPSKRTETLWEFDLHEHSEGAAATAAYWWIETQVMPWHFGEDKSPIITGYAKHGDVSLELITGHGKSRQVWRKGDLSGGDVKAAVTELLLDMEVPIDETNTNLGRLVIDRSRWVKEEAASSWIY